MAQPEPGRRGRTLLVAVTIAVFALQALKLGSRVLLLDQRPTAGQWGQLALVVGLVVSLWEGRNWARVAAALYYTLAAIVGAAALYLMWDKANPALRVVSVLIVVLAVGVAIVLWFSDALREYMARRLTADARRVP